MDLDAVRQHSHDVAAPRGAPPTGPGIGTRSMRAGQAPGDDPPGGNHPATTPPPPGDDGRSLNWLDWDGLETVRGPIRSEVGLESMRH